MNAQHTPGPWIVIRANGRVDVIATDDPRHSFASAVCEIAEDDDRQGDGVAEANARLITAAPELFAALQQIERLSREADRSTVDVASMLGDIARTAIVNMAA